MNRLFSALIASSFAWTALTAGSSHAEPPSDTELLVVVRKHTLTTDKRRKVHQWIAKLGDEAFVVRETASKALFAVGRLALPQLRAALHDKDAEVTRRAKLLIERIERQPTHPQLASAVRLLALRQPAGTVAALLAFLPHAEEENLSEEVQTSLAALARRDDKAKSVLRRALDDSRQPPAIRMRIALALASAGEPEAVAVLIDLLAVLPADDAQRIAEALYQVAGATAPNVSPGAEATERKRCRDAWANWWKANANRGDLTRLPHHLTLGLTLICDNGGERVYEIDRRGKVRWSIGNLRNFLDAVVVSDNRVLITEYENGRVSERDFQGHILWRKHVNWPVSAQRLPNGNTSIAVNGGAILEVNRAGETVSATLKVPGSLMRAYRWREGTIVCTNRQNQCLLYDTARKQFETFLTYHFANINESIDVDLCANGHILITPCESGKVEEYDDKGKKILEMDAPLAWSATGLPNGHILVASPKNQRVYEMDRAGKVVWEYKGAGHVIRARRR